MFGSWSIRAVVAALVLGCAPAVAWAHTPHECPSGNPDEPAWEHPNVPGPLHISQQDLIDGKYTDIVEIDEESGASSPFGQVFLLGGALAEIRFNSCDGQGRPATVGSGPADSDDGGKRPVNTMGNIRTSGPEATSCFGCHSQPRSGGSGDFVANTFNGAEGMDPVTFSISPEVANERNTRGMFGSGYIELAAREITADLWAQADQFKRQRASGWKVLTSKGINFDVRFQAGRVVEAKGIDIDLIIKPFGAGGTVASIRQFSVQALNRHHGMQAEESYDIYLGDPDFDEDGVTQELTIGDVTVLTLWQAMLNYPVEAPANQDAPEPQSTINLGKRRFAQVGCAGCHTPSIVVQNRVFCEPNPYNPPQIFHDQNQKYCVPLEDDPQKQQRADPNPPFGPVEIKAYTDFKRHNLCDAEGRGAIRALCNEQLAEGRPDQDGRPASEFFLTTHLWDVAASAPYGHDGRYPSLFSIINVHGGEARASRDAFLALPIDDQKAVIKFLKTLRIKNQMLRLNGES
jgi:hypothetical protein